jgi:hypothetical protein
MKLLTYTVFLFTVMLFSCASEKNKDNNNGVTFNSYLKCLPKITLPYTFNTSDFRTDLDNINLDKDYSEFIPSGNMYAPYGIYFTNDSITGIIYTIQASVSIPCLITHNTQTGKTIGDLLLWENSGFDPAEEKVNIMTINKDLTMAYFDSTYSTELDKDMDVIPGSEKIIVLRKEYKVDEKGKIILLHEEKAVKAVVPK